MSFFYIDSNIGTRVAGGGTTAQTGSMATLGAANVYANRATAIADGAGSGDFLMCADNHSHDYAANTTLAGPTSGVPIKCISVDTTNIDQYKTGAFEQSSGNADLIMSGDWACDGFNSEASDDVGTSGNDSSLVYNNGVFRVSAIDDALNFGGGNGNVELNNTEIKLDDANARILSISSKMVINGGSVTTTSGGINALFESANGLTQLNGVNLLAVTGDILQHGGVSADNKVAFMMHKCPIGSGAVFLGQTLLRPGISILATQCSNSSAAAEYQYHYEDFYGVAEDQDDTGIFRAESTAFPSGTQSSLKVTTNSNCEQTTPLSFRPFSRFMELSVASTDTARIYFVVANTVTLTDTDVWAELIYPDGTSKNVFNYLSNRNTDILAAGTTHTTDSSSDWRDGAGALTGFNEYQMDLDTSGDVGADGVPIIILHVGLDTSATPIYVDRTVGVVA